MNPKPPPPPPTRRWTVDSIKRTLRLAMNDTTFRNKLPQATLRLLVRFAPARSRWASSKATLQPSTVTNRSHAALRLLIRIQRFKDKLRSYNCPRDVILALIANGVSPDTDEELLTHEAACVVLKNVPSSDLLPLRVFAASLVMLDTLQKQPEQSNHTGQLRFSVRSSVNKLLTLIVPKESQTVVSKVINRLMDSKNVSDIVDMLYKRKIVKPRNPLSVMVLHLAKRRDKIATVSSVAAMRSASRAPKTPRERPESVAAVVELLRKYVQRMVEQRRNAQQRQTLMSRIRTEALIEKLRAPIAQPERPRSNNATLRNRKKAWYIRLGFNNIPSKNALIARLNGLQRQFQDVNVQQFLRDVREKHVSESHEPV